MVLPIISPYQMMFFKLYYRVCVRGHQVQRSMANQNIYNRPLIYSIQNAYPFSWTFSLFPR
jgi:hypothetical protein